MERHKKPWIEWGKTMLIIMLTCTALYLITQTTLYSGIANIQRTQQKEESPHRERGEYALSVQPYRMAVQNQNGRFATPLDGSSTGVDLFEHSLGGLLLEALLSVQAGESISEQAFYDWLLEGEYWIYYDFLYDLPLAQLT